MSGYRRHLLILTMLIILTLPMFVDASISETETTLTSLEFELTSGNSIDWDRTPIVSTDVTGVLQLDPKKDGYADVHVIFQDGKNLATVEASNTPLTKEVTTCSDKSQSIRIGVTDTTNNVFLSLLVLENGSLYISVATVISSVRYSGTTLIQSSSITESDWDIILSNYQTKTETFVDLESLPEDFDRSFKGKSTVRATTLASGEGGRSKSGDKIYYLAYYDIGLDKYREGYPEYLNTTVLENSFCTDFISRSNPSVVDIKGDLAAYCDNENNNYLGVYHLAFHGSFNDDDPDDPYVNIHLGGTQNILHCGDISEMWDAPDCTPKDAIVVSWCCNSLRDKLWDEENPGETDNFCEAFLELEYNGEDYGAKAYIGGENTIAGPVALQNPKRRDRGTPMLFECLARSDMSVNDSVQFVNERGLVDNDCLHFRIQEDISSPVYLRNDDSTEPNFPDDWRFYKTHIIEKTSGAGEDYQVHIRVDYGSGSDGGVIVYMQNGDGVPHCQVDFDDIRFQWKNSSDEWEMLDHWKYYVEVSGGGHYADFWVEISGDLDEDDQQIRIYYGDTGANAAEETSNASATFPLYDDFSGNSVNSNIWRVHSGTNSSVSDGLLQITGSEDGDVLTSKWSDSGDDYVYKIRAKMVTDVTNGKWCGFWLRDQFFDTYNYFSGSDSFSQTFFYFTYQGRSR